MLLLIGPDDQHLVDYAPYLAAECQITQNQGTTLDELATTIRDRTSGFDVNGGDLIYAIDNSQVAAGAPQSYATGAAIPDVAQHCRRIFGGYVKVADPLWVAGPERDIRVDATEFGGLLPEANVTVYVNAISDKAAIAAICTYAQNNQQLVGVDFTTHVQALSTVNQLSWNFKSAQDALGDIINQTGAAFWMDYYRALWYQLPLSSTAAIGFSTTPDNVTTFGFGYFSLASDATQGINEQIVQGTLGISGPIAQNLTGDGHTTTFYLNGSSAGAAFPIADVTAVTVGGATQVVGVIGHDTPGQGGYTCAYAAQQAYITFAVAPGNGVAVVVTYRLAAPPLVRVHAPGYTGAGTLRRKVSAFLQSESIASQQSALDRAHAEVALWSKPQKIGQLTCWQSPTAPHSLPPGHGLAPGQAVPIWHPYSKLSGQYFQVVKVVVHAYGGHNYKYDVSLGVYRPGLVHLMAQAYRLAARTAAPPPSSLLYDVVSFSDGWALTDSAGAAESGVGYWGASAKSGKWGAAAGALVWG